MRSAGHVPGNYPINDADLDQTIDCFIVAVMFGPLLVQTDLPVSMTTQILDKAEPKDRLTISRVIDIT